MKRNQRVLETCFYLKKEQQLGERKRKVRGTSVEGKKLSILIDKKKKKGS